MSLREKQSVFAHNVAMLIDYIYACGYNVTFGEAYRTAEQAQIYEQQGKGIKNSLHCKRLAIDLNVFDAAGNKVEDKILYQPFGIYWEKLHKDNRWGGNFKTLVDSNHFEMQDT